MEEAKKARKQAERARNQAEQDGYDAGVIEIEEALRVEVPGVYKTYCSQTWYKALNQARVEASSMLRKVENVYYPLAIRRSIPIGSRTDAEPEREEVSKDSTTNVTTSFAHLSKEAEQPRATEKEKNVNQRVALNAMKPLTTIQDPLVEKEAPGTMEIVLVSLPLPAKSDPVSKGPKASEAAST